MRTFKDFRLVEEEQPVSAIWKVDIQGLPSMYMNGRSAGDVKNALRKLLKSPGDVILDIKRVLPTEVKKDLRLRLTGKADLEGDRTVSEAPEDMEPASPDEAGMAKAQLNFIAYAADEILDYIEEGAAFPEWFQNKLTKVHENIKDLHAYMEGENHDEDEEDEDEEDMNEAVEVSHDRYMRSHGKKASGGQGMWMFTNKRMGDVDHKDMFHANGKFADAAKAAKAWAKKNGYSTVYVMESTELDEGYKASSEKSRFGGYRAKLLNPQGKVSYLGSTGWKTPEAAEGEAEAYRKGYFDTQIHANERMANKMTADYKQKNKDKIAVREGYSPDTDPDAQKNKRITDGDKKKLGAIAQMMAREKAAHQRKLAQKAREAGDHEAAKKHDDHARAIESGK